MLTSVSHPKATEPESGFNKTLKWSLCPLKFEKQWSRSFQYQRELPRPPSERSTQQKQAHAHPSGSIALFLNVGRCSWEKNLFIFFIFFEKKQNKETKKTMKEFLDLKSWKAHISSHNHWSVRHHTQWLQLHSAKPQLNERPEGKHSLWHRRARNTNTEANLLTSQNDSGWEQEGALDVVSHPFTP